MRLTKFLVLALVGFGCASGGGGQRVGMDAQTTDAVVPSDARDAASDTLDSRVDARSDGAVAQDANRIDVRIDTNVVDSQATDTGSDAIVVVSPDATVGMGWTPIGAPLNAMPGMTSATLSDLAIDNQNRVVAAFLQALPNAPNSNRVYVFRYENNAWVNLGTPGGGSSEYGPKLAIKDGNEIYVSFGTFTGGGMYSYPVFHYTGGNWSAVGTPVQGGSNFLMTISLAHYSNQVWLAFTETPGINTPMSAKAYRFDGSNWTLASTVSPSGNLNVTRPQLIPINGALYFKTIENGANMYAYTGSATFTALGSGLVDIPSGHSFVEAYGFWGNDNRLAIAQAAQSSATSDTYIYLSDYMNQGGWTRWSPAISAYTGSGTYAGLVDAIADGTGNAYVMFSEPETGVSNAPVHMFLYRCVRSNAQCARVGDRLDAFSGPGTNAHAGVGAVALGDDNLPVVAWAERESENGVYSIVVRRAQL